MTTMDTSRIPADELKSVEEIIGIHEAQLRTYMKLAKVTTGLLMNFNVARLKDGLKRFVL